MQSELECTICMENFDTGTHKPLLLPCSHTFCIKCTKDIYKNNGIECPVCFQEHKIPFKKIPPNQELLNQLKDMKKKGPISTEDDMSKKFALEFLDNNIEQARAILLTYDWNYETAAQSLNIQQNKFQSYAQIDLDGKGPYHKEEKIKLLMRQCAMISHEDQAQFLLEDNEWHVESVLKLYEQQSSVMDQIKSSQQNLNYENSSSLVNDYFSNAKAAPQLTASGFEDFDFGFEKNNAQQPVAVSQQNDFGFVVNPNPPPQNNIFGNPPNPPPQNNIFGNQQNPPAQNGYPNLPSVKFGGGGPSKIFNGLSNGFSKLAGGGGGGGSSFQILLTNCADSNDSYFLEFPRDNSFGMQIIEKLVQVKPLFGKGENAVYNIYRDQQKQRCINYTMLSNSLQDLQLESQPPAPGYPSHCRIIYFSLDFEMRFD